MKEKKIAKFNKTFSREFKEEAVELAKREGNSKAARELGVSETCIRNWRIKQESPTGSSGQAKTKKTYDELERDNRRLGREINYLKEINKVLKKSTAIFSSEHMDFLK